MASVTSPISSPETIVLSGPGLVLTFTRQDDRLALAQVQRGQDAPLLYADAEGQQPGAGPLGGPLLIRVNGGSYDGLYDMSTLCIIDLTHTATMLRGYFQHDTMPLRVGLEIEVEGHVATWRGQAVWTGDTAVDMELYYPVLSRIRFAGPDRDRALMPSVSGIVLGPLGEVNRQTGYLGNGAIPAFLVEGGGRGLAILDDNRADYAADPGACVQRAMVVTNTIPVPRRHQGVPPAGDTCGPCVAMRHARYFHPQSHFSFSPQAELLGDPNVKGLPMVCEGDTADLGPIRTYAYTGTWKTGALWIREQRRHMPFRTSPATWYQRATFMSEDMGDHMVQRGQSFYDYPKLTAHKETLGSDLFHIPGFHDAEVLGSSLNWLNRGDYTLAAHNLGGFEAARRGIEAIHRRGGRISYYVEGLIIWKRSRIGRGKAREWALMHQDGTYEEHYRGFWHMCPACAGWRHWLAETCAQIVRDLAVDAFFIDSSTATSFHRCFNPAHDHPHPDVWNWGLRQMLREVREAVDRVNPDTIIFVEGAGDIAREFADGFVTHTHDWNGHQFTEPFVRFVHPEMRAFESWGGQGFARQIHATEWMHVWNSVTGHRIYAHAPHDARMAALGRHTRAYYDLYPEICDHQMSVLDVKAKGCMACLFDGMPMIMTAGNLSAKRSNASLGIPIPCGMLFDRVDGLRVPVVNGKAKLALKPWEFRAFELRA